MPAQSDGAPASRSAERVLVVANRLPYPADDGWKRRTFHVLKALASCRPVTLACLSGSGSADVDALRRVLGERVDVIAVPPPLLGSLAALPLGLVTGTPYHVWKQRSAQLDRVLDELIAAGQQFELAVATLAHLYPYLERLPAHVRRVVDTHNVDSVVLERYAARMSGGARRSYARITAAKLRAHEARVFASADLVWVCSRTEVDMVHQLAPAANVGVIPNGVDTTGDFAPIDVPREPHRIVFFGRLDYFPNADAVEHFATAVLPRIRRDVSDIEFCVVGPGASDALRSLLARTPGCRFVGPVDDLRQFLSGAALIVVPLRVGGGTRLKILEALSLRQAVVSTSVGAEGLDLVDGRDLLIADADDAFATAVTSLLRDPAQAQRLGDAGRTTVTAHYDWSLIEQRMVDALGLAGNPRPYLPDPR